MNVCLPRRSASACVAIFLLIGVASMVAEAAQTKSGSPKAKGLAATPDAKRRVLKPTDLVYHGSFAPPKTVQGISTSYTSIGLATRIVDGKRRFFAGAGPNDAGVYEMNFPGLAKITTGSKSWPNAKVIRWWGDITQGKCVVANKNTVMKQGLFWDERTGRLYWTYGSVYNADGANDPCLGWSELAASGPVAHGPFRVTGGRAKAGDKSTRAVSASCRGGVLRIPEWFAKQYTPKRTLGIGFGGYYNIVAAGVSMGPALFAVDEPDDANRELAALPCVGHTFVQSPPGTHYAKRSTSYTVASNDWVGIAPVKGVGYWTAMDSILSACCWVDLPEVSGLVFMPSLAKGPVSYEIMNGRGRSGGAESWLYIYDPADLASVAQGKKYPWEIEPATMVAFAPPLGGRLNGLVFDQAARTLFVLATYAYEDGVERFPLIHAYGVK
jgi:hypothetical protein